jgi:molybdate transport system substrate-binding protein
MSNIQRPTSNVQLGITFSFLLASVLVLGSARPSYGGATINVAAAISLKPALEEIAKAYETATDQRVELAFGSSGQLMTQIKAGAPIDLFIAAAEKQVDELIDAKLADRSSRRVVAGNTLVLIAPRDAPDPPSSIESIGEANVKRLAVGEPKTVPAGQYAEQVIHKLNLAEKLKDKVVYGANVRQVLDYVVRGEASAGFVYATDAKDAGDKVRVAATADSSTHDPIVYPAVVIKASSNQDTAKKFLDYLASEKSQAILKSHGFAAGSAVSGN